MSLSGHDFGDHRETEGKDFNAVRKELNGEGCLEICLKCGYFITDCFHIIGTLVSVQRCICN